MKTFIFLTFTVFLSAQSVFASTIVAAYKCELSTSKPNDPEWKMQTFPLIKESSGWTVSEASGDPNFFELSPVDPSQLSGWPTYKNGKYYAGNNDIFVIIENGKSVQVVKPLETDPNTSQRPSTYNCVQVPLQ